MFDKCCDCDVSPGVDDVCCAGSILPGCPTTVCGDCTKVGTITMPTSLSDQTLDFGTQPLGLYIGTYCGGMYSPLKATSSGATELCCNSVIAAAVFDLGAPQWGLTQGSPDPIWAWQYNDLCFDCSLPNDGCSGYDSPNCTGRIAPATPGTHNGTDFTTEAAAIAAYAGTFNVFGHAGGNISLKFIDCPLGDNTDGTPLPSFSLYQCPAITTRISMFSACASWVSLGHSAQVKFNLRNHNCICWGEVTATLDVSGGGSSSPSSPQTGITIPCGPCTTSGGSDTGSGVTPLTFTFDATGIGVTATLTLSSPLFSGGDIVLTVFLAPIISATMGRNSGDATSTICGPTVRYNLFNYGNWTINPSVMTVNLSNGYSGVTNVITCASTNPFNVVPDGSSTGLACVFDFGFIPGVGEDLIPGETTSALEAVVPGTGGSAVATITDIKQGSFNYGGCTTPSFTF